MRDDNSIDVIGPDLPTLTGQGGGRRPRRGYKRAFIVASEERFAFEPLWWPAGARYLVDDVAQCRNDAHPVGEPIPHVKCTCGFWAVADPDQLDHHTGSWNPSVVQLDVELSGLVVEYGPGWRASHQSVLGAHYQSRCAKCAKPALCAGEQKHDPRHVVMPLCEHHAGKAERTWTFGQLAERLGCELSADGAARAKTSAKTRSIIYALPAAGVVAGLVAGLWAGPAVAVAVLVCSLVAAGIILVAQSVSGGGSTPALSRTHLGLLFAGLVLVGLTIPSLALAFEGSLGAGLPSPGERPGKIEKVAEAAWRKESSAPSFDRQAWKVAGRLSRDLETSGVQVVEVTDVMTRLAVVTGGDSVDRCWGIDVTNSTGVADVTERSRAMPMAPNYVTFRVADCAVAVRSAGTTLAGAPADSGAKDVGSDTTVPFVPPQVTP